MTQNETTDPRPWWAIPIHPSSREQHADNALHFVKTLLEIRSAINPRAYHRFRWVVGTAVHVQLLSAFAPYRSDLLMVARAPEVPDLLVGLALRVDENVDGLYLEWVA